MSDKSIVTAVRVARGERRALDVAIAVRITPSRFSMIENAKLAIPESDAQAISDELGVPLEGLFVPVSFMAREVVVDVREEQAAAAAGQ